MATLDIDPTRSSVRASLDATEIADRATKAYGGLRERFRRKGTPVDFDFRRHCVAWTARGDHFTHRLHRYPGRLTPYIPLFFLSVRGVATSSGRLLDPFAGCGTVLVEAPVHPVHPMSAVGLEINPLARLIAKVKTTPLERRSVIDSWNGIHRRHQLDKSRAGLAEFPNKRHWFSKKVERRLARLLRALTVLRNRDLRDFFLVAASSVVRQVALADPSVSVPVKIDPSRFDDKVTQARLRADLYRRSDADVLEHFDAAVRNNLSRVCAWSEARAVRRVRNTIVGADARKFRQDRYIGSGHLKRTKGPLSGIDLILTSPPYANAQRYTRSLRLELFALGYAATSVDESRLDRLQIGTERVPFSEWPQMLSRTGSRAADRTIRLVSQRDRYRAAIVGKYVRDMKTVVLNCFKALNPGGHLIFVIGNNRVCGQVLNNTEILAGLAKRAGFRETLRVRNKIPSRGLLTKRHHTAGVITHEHVLVLRKPISKT